ncbi:uncharacterized protein MYCFIDRAFT_176228 [Pseudocercospora fijiensis CIRAD86]|uniref:Uncharacterized protein n=1 Tax=Pseudocercospora fijiensis (strain CIRAD86) TaxID=383855 RepID=M3ATQ5_PSEFD|nr:uncharacterized protein MYCFIDRAFT_176228 [Pseudocercospora fijiensis CIRAD86]EME80862.1 hypothetical protein MYCFIDRAFT_176228 [Pseudocercospora fijiensis CIRAD86]
MSSHDVLELARELNSYPEAVSLVIGRTPTNAKFSNCFVGQQMQHHVVERLLDRLSKDGILAAHSEDAGTGLGRNGHEDLVNE